MMKPRVLYRTAVNSTSGKAGKENDLLNAPYPYATAAKEVGVAYQLCSQIIHIQLDKNTGGDCWPK
jgi:hypothetical protein